MKKYRCKHCDGDGRISDTKDKVVTGIFTLGLVPVLDWLCNEGHKDPGSIYVKKCRECNGKGYVERDWD